MSTSAGAGTKKPKGKGLMFRRRANRKKEMKEDEGGVKKVSSALLRLNKDLAILDLPKSIQLIKGKDPLKFDMVFTVENGYWKKYVLYRLYSFRLTNRGHFKFSFSFPESYPFDGPKVLCVDKVCG